MDFVSDRLFDGRRFRLLALVDNFTRESLAIRLGQRLTGVDHFSCESLAIEVGQRFRGQDVARVLTLIGAERGLPKTIRVDNGSEFTSKALDQWAYANGVQLDFSRPGKPTDNALIESFSGRLRAECLNESWFLSLEDVEEMIGHWRMDYNEHRPHSALGNLAPRDFASTCQACLAS